MAIGNPKGCLLDCQPGAFGISRNDNVITFHPAHTVKASKNVLQDHLLPMIESLRARNAFLRHAFQAG